MRHRCSSSIFSLTACWFAAALLAGCRWKPADNWQSEQWHYESTLPLQSDAFTGPLDEVRIIDLGVLASSMASLQRPSILLESPTVYRSSDPSICLHLRALLSQGDWSAGRQSYLMPPARDCHGHGYAVIFLDSSSKVLFYFDVTLVESASFHTAVITAVDNGTNSIHSNAELYADFSQLRQTGILISEQALQRPTWHGSLPTSN